MFDEMFLSVNFWSTLYLKHTRVDGIYLQKIGPYYDPLNIVGPVSIILFVFFFLIILSP